MVAMRDNPQATAVFQAIHALCETMAPGDYDLVTHIGVRDEPEA